MPNRFGRLLISLGVSSILLFTIVGLTLANISSKTIDTTTGACSNTTETDGDPETTCGSAVYGANGFTGTINFDSDPSGLTVVDYICTHTPGDGPFVSYTKGGEYTLTISGDDFAPVSATYTVTGGVDCVAGVNAVVNGTDDGVLIPTTTDLTLQYSITIQGVTAASASTDFPTCGPSTPAGVECFNSIRNRAFASDGSHADSPSVKPPTTPPGEIPESPVSALLVLTAGLGAGWFAVRRMGVAGTPSAAA